MDRVFSARMDDNVIRQIGVLARELRTTKKGVIEAAVRSYAQTVKAEKKIDVFGQTCGAWKRDEPPSQTVEHVRKGFHTSMRRYCR
ncbi:MAG: hypothetical protein HY706_04005 [Candidatus Hydrogenedentes bacterium]|nr:hypothetical protein [Candidatus Hydrogenedentota bacterium]